MASFEKRGEPPMRNVRGVAGLLVPVLVLAVPSSLHAQAGKRPSKQYTIEQFMATTSVTGASFSADEKRPLYSSNQSGIFNVYSVPVAGGRATPHTPPPTGRTIALPHF